MLTYEIMIVQPGARCLGGIYISSKNFKEMEQDTRVWMCIWI